MKNLILLLVIASVFSCSKSKKEEDPKPVQVLKLAPVQDTTKPYYKDFTQKSTPFTNGGYLDVTFIGHDDLHVPKADVYKWDCHCNGNNTADTREIRVWWIDCQPYSDYASLYFKKGNPTNNPSDCPNYWMFATDKNSNSWWTYSR